MSSQISDSLSKVNHLMSEVEDSFSSVLSSTEFLPIIAELLKKMHNIVYLSQMSNVNDSFRDDNDMWWDQSDVSQVLLMTFSSMRSFFPLLAVRVRKKKTMFQTLLASFHHLCPCPLHHLIRQFLLIKF